MSQSTPTAKRRTFSGLSLQRIVTSNRFIPQVDGFRFLAITIVVIAHIIALCAPPVQGTFGRIFVHAFADGKRGVYLFFTISGFILALPFARHHLLDSKRVDLRSYFKRRVTRLEPPYIIVMLLRAPALLMVKGTSGAAIAIHLLASLFYVHNLVFDQYSTINPPAWSLEIEIQFYILAPILSAVFLIRPAAVRRALIIAITLASALLATFLIAPQSRAELSLLNYFQYFGAGFLLCDVYLLDARFSLPPWVWDLVGLAALAWILLNHGFWSPVVLPFVTLCLYMAGFYGVIVRKCFSVRAITIIGGMCYSIYLTHPVILTLVRAILARGMLASWRVVPETIIVYAVCVGGILALGTLYFILIERPCMDPSWPRKLARQISGRSREAS